MRSKTEILKSRKKYMNTTKSRVRGEQLTGKLFSITQGKYDYDIPIIAGKTTPLGMNTKLSLQDFNHAERRVAELEGYINPEMQDMYHKAFSQVEASLENFKLAALKKGYGVKYSHIKPKIQHLYKEAFISKKHFTEFKNWEKAAKKFVDATKQPVDLLIDFETYCKKDVKLITLLQGTWKDTNMEYTFRISSTKAINFDEIKAGLTSECPAVIVKVLEDKAKKDIETEAEVHRLLTSLSDTGKLTDAQEEAVKALSKPLRAFYYVVISDQLLHKLEGLGEEYKIWRDVFKNSPSGANTTQITLGDTSRIKLFLRSLISAKWPDSYYVSVNVKGLL